MNSTLAANSESLRRPELALWLIVLFVVCFSSVVGRSGLSGMPEIRFKMGSAAHSTLQPLSPAGSAWRMDVNTASEQDLEMLPGIGPRRAQAIVQERRKRGGFSSVWELSEVPGLTPALVHRIEALLQVPSPAPH